MGNVSVLRNPTGGGGDVQDQVGVFRQVPEPVRHKDHRSTFSFLSEVGKETVFGFGVEGRAGLVDSDELDGRGEEAHERPGTKGCSTNE